MPSDRRLAAAVGLDVFVVVLFVAVGRRNHDEEPALSGLLTTAAPFLIGLGVAWAISRAWNAPTSPRKGLAIWPLTVVVGMLVRRVVFDDGTALPFVIVATVFVGAGLVGWRALAHLVTSRRPAVQASGGSLTAK